MNELNEEVSLTLKSSTPQNGQTHSNYSSATADELFECVCPFCAVGAKRDKIYTDVQKVKSNMKHIFRLGIHL